MRLVSLVVQKMLLQMTKWHKVPYLSILDVSLCVLWYRQYTDWSNSVFTCILLFDIHYWQQYKGYRDYVECAHFGYMTFTYLCLILCLVSDQTERNLLPVIKYRWQPGHTAGPKKGDKNGTRSYWLAIQRHTTITRSPVRSGPWLATARQVMHKRS